jgi:exopolyphosphatase/guanosine-5'-triphosphate,3'-diphosphate pyrophosphatase
VEVITGEEEARLSFLAVSRDPRWREAGSLLVIDIGGGSTEVIVGNGAQGKILLRESLPIGAVRLTEATLLSDPPAVQHMASANRMAATALDGFEMRLNGCVAVGVGGTLSTMGAVHLHIPTLDLERIHGTRLMLTDVEEQVARYAALTIEERKQIVGLEPSRADIILGGAIILCHILCKTHLDAVAVSCRGLRWGVLYDRFGGSG